jgi:hypothetical protein
LDAGISFKHLGTSWKFCSFFVCLDHFIEPLYSTRYRTTVQSYIKMMNMRGQIKQDVVNGSDNSTNRNDSDRRKSKRSSSRVVERIGLFTSKTIIETDPNMNVWLACSVGDEMYVRHIIQCEPELIHQCDSMGHPVICGLYGGTKENCTNVVKSWCHRSQ